MKKIIVSILCFILVFGFSLCAFAEEKTEDNSTPRLMVTDYKIDSITPGKKSQLTITVKNTSSKKAVKNILFTLSDGEKELVPDGMGTVFIDSIVAENTYIWKTNLTAIHSAKEGRHELTFSAEYEDKSGTPYSANASIFADVKQAVNLDFSNAVLPKKAVQGETISLSINLMNTGKSEISNVKVDCEIDGLTSGGTAFAGIIPVGESRQCSINLNVTKEKLGEIKGKIIFSYEDCFGKKYTKEQDVSTVIEKKVETEKLETKTEEKKNPQWWLFLLGGILLGGTVGAAVPIAIHSSKQRKEDEKRL